MDKIKLCKDCEHYRVVEIANGEKTLGCKHNTHEVSLVTGQIIFRSAYFYRQEPRYSHEDKCEPQGKHFTPRKSLWQRVKGWLG